MPGGSEADVQEQRTVATPEEVGGAALMPAGSTAVSDAEHMEQAAHVLHDDEDAYPPDAHGEARG